MEPRHFPAQVDLEPRSSVPRGDLGNPAELDRPTRAVGGFALTANQVGIAFPAAQGRDIALI
jgi:hypothetical protein